MERYRIEGRLGRSTANIFRVTRVTDGCPFVMKRLPLSQLDDDAQRQAHMEMGLASRVRHPHLAHCEDAFYVGESDLCLVLTHYSRGDLAHCLASRVAAGGDLLTEDQVMAWFVDVALGLHYLHSHGIVHRDVKSSNIFLENVPQAAGAKTSLSTVGHGASSVVGSVVLGDLGIARVVGSNPRAASPTSNVGPPTTTTEGIEASGGTPQYMAPELLQSANAHSFKSDVWSLGCVLYELLCFRHPFEARDVSALVVKVITGHFAPIPQRYSRECCELLVRLLDVSPVSRPDIDEVLCSPFVSRHLRKRFAATERTVLRPAERRNFAAQMNVLGMPMSPTSVAGTDAAAAAQVRALGGGGQRHPHQRGGHAGVLPPSPPQQDQQHHNRVNQLSPHRVSRQSGGGGPGFLGGSPPVVPTFSRPPHPVGGMPSPLESPTGLNQGGGRVRHGRRASPPELPPSADPAPSSHPHQHLRQQLPYSPHAGPTSTTSGTGGTGPSFPTGRSSNFTGTRYSVASSGAVARGAQHRDALSPRMDGTGTTATSGAYSGISGVSPRSEQEAALYDACRDRDIAVLQLKEAQRRNISGVVGGGARTVKDTVDRVVYGPPIAGRNRAVPREPLLRGGG